MASIAAVLLIAILSALTSGRYVSVYGFSAQVRTLWAAAAVGALGAFFSIAIAIRGRTVLTDLHSRDNAADAVLRIVIGAIAAGLLVCFVLSRVAVVTIGGTALEVGTGNSAWMVTVIAAFLAGFSERLVPDLLEKSALNAAGADNSTAPGGAPPQQPANSRSAAQAAAAPADEDAGDDEAIAQEAEDDVAEAPPPGEASDAASEPIAGRGRRRHAGPGSAPRPRRPAQLILRKGRAAD